MTDTITFDAIDELAATAFEGYVVRKDLAQQFKGAYQVPTYVGEFLIGRYCATTDPEEIEEGLQVVRRLLSDRTVRAGEEELFKSRARERMTIKLIDLVKARLDAKSNVYLAELPSLGLKDVRIDDAVVRDNERMLTRGSLERLAEGRAKFTTEQWKHLLLRSVGFEPEQLVAREQDVLLLRMVPFVQRNFNMVELGPRGTG